MSFDRRDMQHAADKSPSVYTSILHFAFSVDYEMDKDHLGIVQTMTGSSEIASAVRTNRGQGGCSRDTSPTFGLRITVQYVVDVMI